FLQKPLPPGFSAPHVVHGPVNLCFGAGSILGFRLVSAVQGMHLGFRPLAVARRMLWTGTGLPHEEHLGSVLHRSHRRACCLCWTPPAEALSGRSNGLPQPSHRRRSVSVGSPANSMRTRSASFARTTRESMVLPE